jgi:hypothetical protein
VDFKSYDRFVFHSASLLCHPVDCS